MKYFQCKKCGHKFNYYTDNWFESTVICPKCHSYDIDTISDWHTTPTADISHDVETNSTVVSVGTEEL